MKAEVTMYRPYPSSGQPARRPRPAAPAPVLTAVRLMYAGAAVSAVCVIVSLVAAVGDAESAARGRWLGYSLTAARLGQLKPLVVTVVTVGGLVVIALWLWMARANGQGRNWARILSTVLFGLATLQLAGYFRQPAAPVASSVEMFGAALAWLPGIAAIWLLWRPASSGFFAHAGHRA